MSKKSSVWTCRFSYEEATLSISKFLEYIFPGGGGGAKRFSIIDMLSENIPVRTVQFLQYKKLTLSQKNVCCFIFFFSSKVGKLVQGWNFLTIYGG